VIKQRIYARVFGSHKLTLGSTSMHKIIALTLVPNAQVLEILKFKSCHRSHTQTHIKSCTYTHMKITHDSTQAQYLAKVFNSPKIKHLNKVLI
jgi:hypothetical protein